MLHCLHRALNVDEISMRETSRLPSTSVNGNTDIDNIANALEEIVKVAISHLEGHVTDEERLGGRVQRLRVSVKSSSAISTGQGLALVRGILHRKATTFEELLVECLDGFRSRLGSLKVYVAKSVRARPPTLAKGPFEKKKKKKRTGGHEV
jgi:hypothetical protein